MVKMKPTQGIYAGSPRSRLILRAVVTDRFDRATFHRFLAQTLFLGRFRLLVNELMTAVVVALEIRGGGFAAKVAVNTLLIDIELAGRVFRILVGDVSHNFPLGEREVRWKCQRCNSQAERFPGTPGEFETA